MLAALLLTALLSQSALPELERILLPVYSPVPIKGAYGSEWNFVLTMRNDSGETSLLFPPDCPPGTNPGLCAAQRLLSPGTTRKISLYGTRPGPVVVSVTKALVAKIFIQLRVSERSREHESYGTDLPVVRSRDLRTAPSEILDVPLDDRFRVTLRLYADDVKEPSLLRVHVVNDTTGGAKEFLFRVERPVFPPGFPPDEPYEYPHFFAEVANLTQYPEIQGTGNLRVEIAPATPGLRYWAFVTVTNNSSQHITTLVPR